jgi:hypothetical protein
LTSAAISSRDLTWWVFSRIVAFTWS